MTDKETITALEHLMIRVLALPYSGPSSGIADHDDMGSIRKAILGHFKSKLNPQTPTLESQIHDFMDDTGAALGFGSYTLSSDKTNGIRVEANLHCYKCQKSWSVKPLPCDIVNLRFQLIKSRIDHVCERFSHDPNSRYWK